MKVSKKKKYLFEESLIKLGNFEDCFILIVLNHSCCSFMIRFYLIYIFKMFLSQKTKREENATQVKIVYYQLLCMLPMKNLSQSNDFVKIFKFLFEQNIVSKKMLTLWMSVIAFTNFIATDVINKTTTNFETNQNMSIL